MAAAGGRPRRVVAVGGGTQGGLWTQIVSDVAGVEQVVPTETVGACFGDAMLAAGGVGAPASGWNPVASVVSPDAGRAAVYQRYYEHYRSLYPATVEVAHFLAGEQRR
ncbi:hypothetical protein GCM10029964_095810 [Kibdelosporangium lantanae]